MREYWVNVYVGGDMGAAFPDRKDAEWFIRKGGFPVVYRIHVRLKPEGAPKRYAGEANRMAWERQPEACREAVENGWYSTQLRGLL